MSYARYCAAAGLILACGPVPAPDDGGADGTGGSSGAASSSSTAGPLSTSTSTGSGPESTTSIDETTGSITGDDITGDAPPESVCDPQPESIVARVVVDEIEEQDEHTETDRDLPCTVASITAGTRIVLECTSELGATVMHTLDVTIEPALELPIEEGLAVQFRLMTYVPWWGDLYVTLCDEAGELLLGYASAGVLFDGCCDVQPDPTLFAPIGLSVVADACELDCDEVDSSFLMDPCPCTRRKAIDFTTPDDMARVYDRGSGSVGVSTTHDLRVASAYTVSGPGGSQCDTVDSPLGWHTILIVRRS